MSNRKLKYYLIQALAGAALLVIGFCMMRFTSSITANFAMMLGGTLGLSGLIGFFVNRSVYTPEEKDRMTRQESIESRDERNIKIQEKSAWLTQRAMSVVLCICVVVVTFVLPFNLSVIIIMWGLLIANFLLPYIFAVVYAKKF